MVFVCLEEVRDLEVQEEKEEEEVKREEKVLVLMLVSVSEHFGSKWRS